MNNGCKYAVFIVLFTAIFSLFFSIFGSHFALPNYQIE